jgi:hypothetical protein
MDEATTLTKLSDSHPDELPMTHHQIHQNLATRKCGMEIHIWFVGQVHPDDVRNDIPGQVSLHIYRCHHD